MPFASRRERLRDRQQEYAEYVEQGLTEELWEPAALAIAQTVIGSDSFPDRIRRATTSVAEKVSGLARAHERMTARLRTNPALRSRVQRLSKKLEEESNS